MEAKEIHNKIISALSLKGPSLPIRLSKDVGLSSLFISAFLSELNAQKRIRISSLKVGGSPLYFLPGQEKLLENFLEFLHPRELEAFLLLKERKVLKDAEQSPQIRVALRDIPDFARGFERDGELFWKYMFANPEELEVGLRMKIETKQEKMVEEKQVLKEKEVVAEKIEPEVVEEKVRMEDSDDVKIEFKRKSEPKLKEEFNNPLVMPKVVRVIEKPKSKFVEGVIDELQMKYKIVEERGYKPKEYVAIVQVKSELGPMNFFCVARDKKKIADSDLKMVLSEAQSIPLPALFVYNGILSKKAVEYGESYFSILKIVKV